MQRLYLFRVLLVLSAIINGSESCSCETLHPQNYYCSSDFVIKGEVKTSGVIRQDDVSPLFSEPFEKRQSVFQQETLVYDVYIEEVYKGGFSRNLNGNQKLEITSCGYNPLANTLTRKQIKGFERTYEKTCDQCSVCPPFGCRFGDSDIDHCTLGLSSRSISQCEIDFARCGKNKRNRCAWLGGTAYRKCKRYD